MIEQEPQKESVIAFRLLCDWCDYAKDFVPLSDHDGDVDDARKEAVRATEYHTGLTGHVMKLREIPTPSIKLGG